MIDYHKQLYSTLKTILPTYYELTLNSNCSIPCISFMERNNYMRETGDTIGYSFVSYQIKVWANDIEVIQEYAAKVDAALKPLGWTRSSSGELYDRNSTMI